MINNSNAALRPNRTCTFVLQYVFKQKKLNIRGNQGRKSVTRNKTLEIWGKDSASSQITAQNIHGTTLEWLVKMAQIQT